MSIFIFQHCCVSSFPGSLKAFCLGNLSLNCKRISRNVCWDHSSVACLPASPAVALIWFYSAMPIRLSVLVAIITEDLFVLRTLQPTNCCRFIGSQQEAMLIQEPSPGISSSASAIKGRQQVGHLQSIYFQILTVPSSCRGSYANGENCSCIH